MPHSSVISTGKPTLPVALSTPLLALIREHTDQPWEVDPTDSSMDLVELERLARGLGDLRGAPS